MNWKSKTAKGRVAFGLFALLGLAAQAAGQVTYYVRPDGAGPPLCDGQADAPYPGSGTGQPCAWDHPFRALPPGGVPVLAGGDTLVISAGSYPMGLGAPGSETCTPNNSVACHMPPIPSGPTQDQPTRILGLGWDSGCSAPPELWGTEGAQRIIDLSGASNVEIACLEITDHSECVDDHSKPSLRCIESEPPLGNWALTGIYAQDSYRVTLRFLDIHGLAHSGIQAARVGDWTLEDVRLAGNGWTGWNGSIPGDDDNFGSLVFRRFRAEWNGCAESYPGQNPGGCWSAIAGGDGDGLSSISFSGRWIFEESAFEYNTGDGLDLGLLGSGAVTEIRRTMARGNAGRQIRVRGPAVLENNIVIGNCGFFDNEPFTHQVESCHGLGPALALILGANQIAVAANNTITSEGNCLLSSRCTSTGTNGTPKFMFLNNIFQGQPQFANPSLQTCLVSLTDCPSTVIDMDYSVIADVLGGVCPGSNDICGVDAGLLDSNIDSFDAHIIPSSPAVDSGLGGSALIPIDDFDGNLRPYGDGVDRGAYELGSFTAAPTRTPTLIPTPSPTRTPTLSLEERRCRKEIRKQATRYFRLTLGAMQKCIAAVHRGEVAGPCPDQATNLELAKAALRVDAEKFDAICPAAILSQMVLGGSCSGARSGMELANCILNDGGAALQAALDVEYAQQTDPLGDTALDRCQSVIAQRAARVYAVKRMRILSSCYARLEKGRAGSCTDPVALARIEKAASNIEPAIAAGCTDALVQQLQAAGGFGGECAAAADIAELATCQRAEHDRITDAVVNLVLP